MRCDPSVTPATAGEHAVKPRALVVDDDGGVRFTLRAFLEDLDLAVEEAATAEDALERYTDFDLLIVDLRMPGMGGLGLLRALGPAASRAIVLTAHGSERHAVEAIKLGAADYLTKPFEPEELRAAALRVLESVRLRVRASQLEGELNLARSMVFRSTAMRNLAELVQRVAPKDVTVLVRGESGTGKERVAQAVVRASSRADRPYVRFNCAAIPPPLVEAELFGHHEGAFTGAQKPRRGLFREAHLGTILLDEIGELDLLAQAKLLRVLQERAVRPVGADTEEAIDVRIIASTHRDLNAMVAEGTFREDLLYRLQVVTLVVPALRDRPEDIRPLVDHFVELYGARFGVETRPSEAWLQRLETMPWPGNVRQLENVVESAVALSDGGWLDGEPAGSNLAAAQPHAGLKERMDAFERGVLKSTLAATGGNRSEAARRLAISRGTLHEKLRKHGIQS